MRSFPRDCRQAKVARGVHAGILKVGHDFTARRRAVGPHSDEIIRHGNTDGCADASGNSDAHPDGCGHHDGGNSDVLAAFTRTSRALTRLLLSA